MGVLGDEVATDLVALLRRAGPGAGPLECVSLLEDAIAMAEVLPAPAGTDPWLERARQVLERARAMPPSGWAPLQRMAADAGPLPAGTGTPARPVAKAQGR